MKRRVERNLAIVGCTIDLRDQALVLASRKMIALEYRLLPQYGPISLFHHLLRLLWYRWHGPHVFLSAFRLSEEIRYWNVSLIKMRANHHGPPSTQRNLTSRTVTVPFPSPLVSSPWERNWQTLFPSSRATMPRPWEGRHKTNRTAWDVRIPFWLRVE